MRSHNVLRYPVCNSKIVWCEVHDVIWSYTNNLLFVCRWAVYLIGMGEYTTFEINTNVANIHMLTKVWVEIIYPFQHLTDCVTVFENRIAKHQQFLRIAVGYFSMAHFGKSY